MPFDAVEMRESKVRVKTPADPRTGQRDLLLDPLDWIHAVTLRIPDPRRHLVRCHGLYANRSRRLWSWWSIRSLGPTGQEFVPHHAALDVVELWISHGMIGVEPSADVFARIRVGSITGPILGTSGAVTVLENHEVPVTGSDMSFRTGSSVDVGVEAASWGVIKTRFVP